MSAGKITSRTMVAIRTATIAISVVAIFAGAPGRAWAICGLPEGLGVNPGTDANGAVIQRQTPLRVLPHGPDEPIVGLWAITATDSNGKLFDKVFSGWTGEGLEFDQDLSPILTGYVCYGAWVKIGKNTYGLTHPFFNYMDVNSNGEGSEATEGQSDGNSGFFNYSVTVAKDGQTFTGKENLVIVQGLNPYDPTATVLFSTTVNLAASKISVNVSQLP